MNEPFEAYVLCSKRSYQTGIKFLDSFVPSRQSLADEFPYPEFADAATSLMSSPYDVIKRLETEPQEGYALYWSSDDLHDFSHAMLVFTKDGGMIAGLAAASRNPGHTLDQIANVVGGRFGYITVEGRPPDSVGEFVDICKRSTMPALVDGIICNNGTSPS